MNPLLNQRQLNLYGLLSNQGTNSTCCTMVMSPFGGMCRLLFLKKGKGLQENLDIYTPDTLIESKLINARLLMFGLNLENFTGKLLKPLFVFMT